jgi:hypothetical protein
MVAKTAARVSHFGGVGASTGLRAAYDVLAASSLRPITSSGSRPSNA